MSQVDWVLREGEREKIEEKKEQGSNSFLNQIKTKFITYKTALWNA